MGTWHNVFEAGGNSSAFITGALNQTTYYRVIVNAVESGCEAVTSSIVTVTVFDDIQITGLSADGSICQGGTWNLSVVATGSPLLLYQWQDSTATGQWTNVSETGGTSTNFTTDALTQTTYYRVFVYATQNGCEDVFSATVTVNVYDDIQITGMSDGGAVCEGGPWDLSVMAMGAPGLLYQWQDSTALGSWENVSESGGTSASFTTRSCCPARHAKRRSLATGTPSGP